MLRIRPRSLWTVFILALLTLSMGLVGWFVTQQTERTVNRFEAQTLPEISTALNLAEGVAQLAALSPYIADAARPFLLQNERNRLEQKFTDLKQVASSIRDNAFRAELDERLQKLFSFVSELIANVREELFLREDIAALRFEIDDLNRLQQKQTTKPQNLEPLLEEFGQLSILATRAPGEVVTNQLQLLRQQISNFIDASQQQKFSQILDTVEQAHSRILVISTRKPYLTASIRAQSEELTSQVNLFVGRLQKSVVQQRREVAETVASGQSWILIVSVLVLAGLLYIVWFNYGLTRDLETVTRDMTRLAEGHTDTTEPATRRKDEIGDLAKSFSVFRQDALRMSKVSQALQAQTKLLETVFNQIHDGLSVFSKDQKLVAWNRRYLEIFDLSPGEVHQGMELSELQALMSLHPHQNLTIERQPIDMQHVNLARLKSAQTFERHYDSGKVVEFRSQPMPEGGFVTLYRDQSDRRAMERQLIQSQKMEVLGQLTGGVAHDFNNLLAALLGSLQLLINDNAMTEGQQRHLQRALRVTEKGVSLIQRLLAFSRKQQLFPERINADDLIEGMLDLVEYSVGQNIEVKTRLQASDRQIFVDPSQLENAILNLAINSSAAMPEGGHLVFQTSLDGASNERPSALEITISDTGEGIPEELQERILEPFFTTKPVGKGSGLGLSMVYGFVNQSGGTLYINSKPGSGTQITLRFPLASQEYASLEDDHEPEISLELAEGSLVYVVEDDLEVQSAIADQLISLDLTIECYVDAESALQHLGQASPLPLALLTDINLQGKLSGVDLKRQCSQLYPQLPVILTSGMPREILESQFHLAPSDLLLAKPISHTRLKGIFRRA